MVSVACLTGVIVRLAQLLVVDCRELGRESRNIGEISRMIKKKVSLIVAQQQTISGAAVKFIFIRSLSLVLFSQRTAPVWQESPKSEKLMEAARSPPSTAATITHTGNLRSNHRHLFDARSLWVPRTKHHHLVWKWLDEDLYTNGWILSFFISTCCCCFFFSCCWVSRTTLLTMTHFCSDLLLNGVQWSRLSRWRIYIHPTNSMNIRRLKRWRKRFASDCGRNVSKWKWRHQRGACVPQLLRHVVLRFSSYFLFKAIKFCSCVSLWPPAGQGTNCLGIQVRPSPNLKVL